MDNKKITPLGGKIWFSVVFFGLVGQIAWMVENMSFATFTQDVFANSSRGYCNESNLTALGHILGI